MEYGEFLQSKKMVAIPQGLNRTVMTHPMVFPFQEAIVKWAVKKGRCAVFADTGLGKTFIQLEWAKHMPGNTLIVAPLTVARQTVREAKKIDIDVVYCRDQTDAVPGISITNYEMIDHFDPAYFTAVVLDESSILKSIDSKTKDKCIEMFCELPYRLCCTATPAPNDISEIANHAEFLGIMTRNELLASFFVHDDEGWRLKKHAEEPFYRWMASWSMSVKRPSDIGYSDEGYDLCPLTATPVYVKSDYTPDGQLFFTGLKGIQDRAGVRKATISDKLHAVKDLIHDNDQYIVWCGLNKEADEVTNIIPGSRNVQGNDDREEKAQAIEDFQDGKYQVLVTKPRVAGFGMNLQNCHKQIFFGLSDSYEAYYQCIRRSWRFGQTHPVEIFIVLSDHEQEIFQNVQRKEAEAQRMTQKLIDHVKQYEINELVNTDFDFVYETDTVIEQDYKLFLGDSAELLGTIEDNSIHLSVFSPPFSSLYVYSPTERDLGNGRSQEEFNDHFRYIVDHLLRVTLPGRVCACHVADVPAMMVRDGYIGMKDLSGEVIRLFIDCGWIFDSRIPIDKNQQAQSIRTHSKGLTMTQMKKDRSWLRPALPDYILKFRKPGDNSIPVKDGMTGDEWIDLANPTWPNENDRCAEWGAYATWYGIKESDTLNVSVARHDRDERHICPLQLGTIERCIKLWSNEGEVICDPFAGIGSTGWKAIAMNRKFVGIELKRNYFNVAKNNLKEAMQRYDGLF